MKSISVREVLLVPLVQVPLAETVVLATPVALVLLRTVPARYILELLVVAAAVALQQQVMAEEAAAAPRPPEFSHLLLRVALVVHLVTRQQVRLVHQGLVAPVAVLGPQLLVLAAWVIMAEAEADLHPRRALVQAQPGVAA